MRIRIFIRGLDGFIPQDLIDGEINGSGYLDVQLTSEVFQAAVKTRGHWLRGYYLMWSNVAYIKLLEA